MAGFLRRQMRYDLMAVEIEVDPFSGRAAFRAPEQLAVKRAGGRKTMHGKGEMKRGHDRFGDAHGDGSRVGKDSAACRPHIGWSQFIH